ncbi:MAG: phage terminase small subunit-related protein [Acetatifactor sp.]
MAAKKNPLSDKAYELYTNGMKLVDIAAKLDVPPGTVRRWKSTHNWDSERSECDSNMKSERSDSVSWVAIEHEYVTDIRKKPCSHETLAKKYGISIQAIKDHAAACKWSEKRTEYKRKISQKLMEKSSDKDANRIARLLQIADIATDKAEQALGELEQYVVRDKKKVRTVEYKDDTAIGKPTKEVIDETESIRKERGPVDRLGLSQVTSALKNIKELYALPVDMESKKYQAELDRRKAEKEGGESKEFESDGFLEALQGDVTATFEGDDIVET